MRPIDHRNATFAEVKAQLHHLRLAAYEAYLAHGPGTTREVAEASGIDLLTLRPRTTELLQLGFLVLADDPAAKAREGRYRALTEAEAYALHARRQAAANATTQLALPLAV